MLNVRTIRKLQNNDGLTLKNGKPITYKTGYQVATHGTTYTNPEDCARAIRHEYKGNCGVWLENGIYYVDHSFRVNTKTKAIEIGKAHNQISVLNWRNMGLVYC